MIGRVSRWFRRAFALDRRYGVRFNGAHEHTGFKSDIHAKHWAEERHIKDFVVFYYDPAVDLRLPGFSHSERDSFKP